MQIEASRELYQTYVQEMPTLEKLQLVRLILDDLMATPQAWLVDESDVWSDEDIEDLTRYTLQHARSTPGCSNKPGVPYFPPKAFPLLTLF